MPRNIALVPLVILLLVQVAVSTEPETPRPTAYNPDSLRILSLLRDESILKALELSPAQRQSLADVQSRWAKEFDAFVQLSPLQRADEKSKLDAAMRDFENQAIAVLSEEQTKKLREFERRRRFALLSPVARIASAMWQDDLRLTSEQRAAIQLVQDEWIDECERFVQTTPESDPLRVGWELMERFRTKYEKLRDDLIRDTFTKEQQERLAQIELQLNLLMGSARELAKPELADQLKLTPEQRQQLEKIVEQQSGGPTPAARRAPGAASTPSRPFRPGLEVLTTDQKQRLRELVGKPFGVGRYIEQALSEDPDGQAETKSDK